MTWPDSYYVTYAYTRGGQLASIFENGDTTGLERLADFTYDQHGRRTLLTRGNGVTTDYDYDAASRLDELVQNLAGTSDDRTLTFSHNPAGQITSRTDSNTGYAWTDFVNFDETTSYNGLNQLLSVTGQSTAPIRQFFPCHPGHPPTRAQASSPRRRAAGPGPIRAGLSRKQARRSYQLDKHRAYGSLTYARPSPGMRPG